MTYLELVDAVQSYTENQFPVTFMADGTQVSTLTQINRFIEQAEQRIFNVIQFPSLRKNSTGTVTASTPYLSAPNDFLSVYSLAVIDGTGAYTYLLNKDVNYIREAYPAPNSLGQPVYYALFGPTVTGGSITNELSFIMGPTPDQNYSVELHYYYYPASIIQAQLSGFNISSNGSGYANGTYFDVPIESSTGSGDGASATVVVSGNAISSVTVSSSGCQYAVGDTLTILPAYVGGVGSGFSATVTTVVNSGGTSWLGDNFDSVLLYGSLVEAYTYMKGEQDILALYDKKFNDALQLAKRLGDGLERQDAYRSGQYRQAVT